ncbi:MAG: hypothetical protein LBN22_00065 [Clostridiales Family XIII bacterium]|nr:hypothetical protein [Clostridiales Family XIII bacterium]
MKHIFILNPAAGSGKSTSILPNIISATKKHNIDYEIHRTLTSGDAHNFVLARLVEAEKNGENLRFYACGGDGTVNEVLGGILGYQHDLDVDTTYDAREICIELAIVPVGSGNDFVRNFPDIDNWLDIDAQVLGSAKSIDALRYELLDKVAPPPPESHSSTAKIATVGYALNMINMGFDAQVVAETAQIKGPIIKGTTAYIAGVMKVLTKMQMVEMTVFADGAEVLFATKSDRNSSQHSGTYLLAGAANGGYSGGGFKGLPMADVSDGFMDLLLVKDVTRKVFLSIVKKYHDGTHFDDPKLGSIIYHQSCKEAVFKPKEKMIVAIDGETVEVGAIKVGILPSVVRLSIPS